MNGATGRPVAYPGLYGLSWLATSELRWLVGRLPPAGLFVEVGTASGVTAALIADARPGLQVLCVDSFPDHDAAHVTDREPCRVDHWRRNRRPNMALWLGDVAQLAALRPARDAAAVLVDAGHEEHDAAADLAFAARVLASDGALYVHDYHEPALPGVKRAADRLAAGQGWRPDGDCGTLRALVRWRQ